MLLVNNKNQNLIALIPCHNRHKITLKSIDYLHKSIDRNISLTIHIIADGCTDGTEEKVYEKYPDITIHRLDGKQYWGGCLNYILELVRSDKKIGDNDNILIANDDVLLSPGSLMAGINYIDLNANTALIPILIEASKTSFKEIFEHTIDLRKLARSVDINWGNIYNKYSDRQLHRQSAGLVNLGVTASLLIKKSTLNAAEKVPVGLPHYYSDFWMTYSLYLKGIKLLTLENYCAIRRTEETRSSSGKQGKIKYWMNCCDPRSPDYLPAAILFSKEYSRSNNKSIKISIQLIKYFVFNIFTSRNVENIASLQIKPYQLLMRILK